MYKVIPQCPRYAVSARGEVLNIKTGKVLRLALKAGYPFFSIYIDGEKKGIRVHRVVAELFVDNPEGKKVVNHKDGDKTNNNASNLEWVTSSENLVHAFKTGLKFSTVRKRVERVDFSGALIESFESVMAAAKEYGLYPAAVSEVCRGRRTEIKGFVFRFEAGKEVARA